MLRPAAFLAGFLGALGGVALERLLGPPQAGDLRARALALERAGQREAAASAILPLLESAPEDPVLREAAASLGLGLVRSSTPLALGRAWSLLEPYARRGALEGDGEAPRLAPAGRALARALGARGRKLGSMGLSERAGRLGGGELEAEPGPEPEVKLEPEPEPEPELRPQPELRPEPEVKPEIRPEPEVKPEIRPEIRSASRAEQARGVRSRGAVERARGKEQHGKAGRGGAEGEQGSRRPGVLPPQAVRLPGASVVAPAAALPTPSGPSPREIGDVCFAARQGDYPRAVRLLDRFAPGDFDDPALDDLASTVYFNASFLRVRAGDCEAGRQLARKAALHDDPWRAPSNLGWMKSLERVQDCQDFNLSTAVRLVELKGLPRSACSVFPGASGPANLRDSKP